jgi:hypothetical protein
MLTAGAAKHIQPSQLDDRLKAGLLIRNVLLPITKTGSFGLHDDSPDYRFKILIF